MASGIQSQFNYNDRTYSATGYPFSNGHLKLEMSWTSVVNQAANTSKITVTVKVRHWALQIGSKKVNVYWNDALVQSFTAAAINNLAVSEHLDTLGTTSFTVTHGSDGTLSGVLRVEWVSLGLSYTSGGVTKSIGELGCLGTAVLDNIPRTAPTITSKTVTVTNAVQVSGVNKIVPGFSVFNLSMAASFQEQGRTIGYRFSYILGGNTYLIHDGPEDSLQMVPVQSGVYQFVLTAYDVDAPQLSTSVTFETQFTVSTYSAPQGQSSVAKRCTSAGVDDDEGTYASITPTFSSGKIDGASISTTCSIKLNNVTVTGKASGSTTVMGGGLLSITSSYEVVYTITDGIKSVVFTDRISIAFFTFDAADGGKGFAFGKEAVDGYFDIAGMTLRVYNPTAVSELQLNPTATGTAVDLINAFCALVAQNLGYATYVAANSWTNHSNGYSIYAVAPKYGNTSYYRISGILYDFPNGIYHFTDNYNSSAGTHNIKMSPLAPWA